MHVPCPTEISDTPAPTARHTKFTWRFNASITYLQISTNFECFHDELNIRRQRIYRWYLHRQLR